MREKITATCHARLLLCITKTKTLAKYLTEFAHPKINVRSINVLDSRQWVANSPSAFPGLAVGTGTPDHARTAPYIPHMINKQ